MKVEWSTKEDFSDTLYGFDCPECGEEVWNDGCDMDPDSPRWMFTCDDCELRFYMKPKTVTIYATEQK